MMKLLTLGIAAALAVATPAAAQDANRAMLDMAAQLRAQAEQLKPSLSEADYRAMLDNAAELEEGAKAGAFSAPTPANGGAAAAANADLSTRIAAEHQGRLEWLVGEEACAGYQWENWRSWTMTVGTNLAERNRLCKAAFAEYEQFFLAQRDGRRAEAEPHLAAYDRLAKEAVAALGR